MMYPKPSMQKVGQPLPAQRPPMQPPMQQSVGWPAQRPINALGMGMQPRPQTYNALAMYGRR